MKKVIWGSLTGVVLFVAVVALIMWKNFGGVSQTDRYEEVQAPSLPTISFELLGREVDPLRGYRTRNESWEGVNTLLPINSDGTVDVNIHTYGTLVDEAQVFLYSLDGSNLLEQTALTLTGTRELTTCYQMTALAQEETDYVMTLQLTLADETQCYYSVKVCQYGTEVFENKETILSFGEEFSREACEKDQEALTPYLSYDRDLAGTDLSMVNLYTGVNLVTWAGLQVEKQQQYVEIYEWSDTQVSMGLRYDANLSYQDEERTAAVQEDFCIRLRDGNLFLLAYERTAAEYFFGNEDSMGNTSILLGIQSSDSLDLLYTDYGINIYFTVDGAVWHYNYNTNILKCVFSFGEDRTDVRLDPTLYQVNLVCIQDQMLYFTVRGYMESGAHEGTCGLALYGYDIAAGTCREYFYGQFVQPDTDGLLQAFSGNGLFYTNMGDSIYALDLTGGDVLKLYEGLDPDTLVVNEDGNMAAWKYKGQSDQIAFFDTDGGTLQTITGTNTLTSLGFIGDDLVYGRAAAEDLVREGFVYWQFFDQVSIVDSTLDVKVQYEKDQVFIDDVEVTRTGVRFSRYMKDGGTYTQMNDDVISLAGEETAAGIVELKVAASEVKRNYYYINLGRTITQGTVQRDRADMLDTQPVILAAKQGENDADLLYEAYVFGESVTQTDRVAAAIDAVYEDMGVVYQQGYLSKQLWNRDARDLYLTMTLPTMTWTQEGHEEELAAMSSLQRGVDIFIYAGVNEGVVDRALAQSSERAACANVYEELQLTFGDRLLNLTGSKIGYLLYYINLRHPVLCLTGEDTARMITGYTSTELMIYDPATRQTEKMTQEEAQEFFDNLNTIFVSFS